ncbi:MAG: hypothetical protein ACRD0H_08090, partial [Actinomycetes bacterium]
RVVIGQLVAALALAEAEKIVREREILARQPAARRALWYQQEAHRRAGRLGAVGWALSGIGIALLPWLMYLGLLYDPVVGLLGLITILVGTVIEVLLAWRLARGYCPDYALLWSLRKVATQAGELLRLKASGKALWFAAAGAVALVILTIMLAPAVPILVMAAHLMWVGQRERAWAQTHARAQQEALGKP